MYGTALMNLPPNLEQCIQFWATIIGTLTDTSCGFSVGYGKYYL